MLEVCVYVGKFHKFWGWGVVLLGSRAYTFPSIDIFGFHLSKKFMGLPLAFF